MVTQFSNNNKQSFMSFYYRHWKMYVGLFYHLIDTIWILIYHWKEVQLRAYRALQCSNVFINNLNEGLENIIKSADSTKMGSLENSIKIQKELYILKQWVETERAIFG